MHEDEFAIIRGLVPVAWADGTFADKEKEMLEALLDAYGASDADKKQLREYAAEKRTLDDINLQDLSAGDRRLLLHNAVILTFADGEQHPAESKLLGELAAKLRIPADEAKSITSDAEAWAKKNMKLLG
jgi:tellurite resistance protein